MFKYIATALALKAFSVCGPTRRVYRALGNAVGNRKRSGSSMPCYYVERVQRMLKLAERYQVLQEGSRVLELGTGWMHWEALTTRLFYQTQADLYDVWDNRQLDALKSYLAQFIGKLDRIPGITPSQATAARELAALVQKQSDFKHLYELLSFHYILEPEGTLDCIPDCTYDLVVSAGVFEHLPRKGVPDYIKSTYRVLRPGGYAVHAINTADHLHLYDRSASPKNYLRYSEKTWKCFFENEVQYINQLQRCEWMTIFAQAGFELLEESSSRTNLTGLPIDSRFAAMDRLSLETTSWFSVYRRPVAA